MSGRLSTETGIPSCISTFAEASLSKARVVESWDVPPITTYPANRDQCKYYGLLRHIPTVEIFLMIEILLDILPIFNISSLSNVIRIK